MGKFTTGVLYGEEIEAVFNDAKNCGYALPAVNCVSLHAVNAAMETAAEVQSPIIIQFSIGGSEFIGGKSLGNRFFEASIAGAIAAGYYVHQMVQYYGIPVILHTDHAIKASLPWIDGLLRAGETFYKEKGQPLFSSHMLDLSAESLYTNLHFSEKYFNKMHRLEMAIEMELGATGGEEEGIDNSNMKKEKLYTHPQEVAQVYQRLSAIGSRFLIAAAFGNVHGVTTPHDVDLKPIILLQSQRYIQQYFNTSENPVNFVFHGGSGTPSHQIKESISYGVMKMNIDTDTQWAFWQGVKHFYEDNKPYMQTQVGNPDSKFIANKKYYDARSWLREAEKNFGLRLKQAFEDLDCIKRN
jgi:fructose-bisphosphate aldolase class II